jgi:hypothetical protein
MYLLNCIPSIDVGLVIPRFELKVSPSLSDHPICQLSPNDHYTTRLYIYGHWDYGDLFPYSNMRH